jgi:hypothetical protein
MKRKCLTFGIILLFAGTCLVPTQNADMIQPMHPENRSALQSVISVSWGNETQKPLVPGGEPRTVHLSVTYDTVLVSLFIGKILLFYYLLKHQYVTIALEIGDIPSWSNASLSTSELRFPVTGAASSQTISLTIAVDEHAPAYHVGAVPINLAVDTLRGPFGFLPFVNGCEQSCSLNFIPGYLPHIIVEPASDFLNVTPGNTSHLPIAITNHGNGRTVVFVDIVDFPTGDWLISIPDQCIFEVNDTQEIILSVVPPSDFAGTETITISFTPHKYDDYSQQGNPVNITIDLICER